MIDFDTARAEFESKEDGQTEWRFDQSFGDCTFCASVAWDPCDDTNRLYIACWGGRWEVAVTDDSGASFFAATESLSDTMEAAMWHAIEQEETANTPRRRFRYHAVVAALLGLPCPEFTVRFGPPYPYAGEPQ